MAYPENTLWGSGDLVIHHAWWGGNHTYPHPTSIDLSFRPERYDGGATLKTVVEWDENGNIKSVLKNKQDGWRPVLTVGWSKLSADETNSLRARIDVCNLSVHPLQVQPHGDLNIWYDMIYDASRPFDPGSPGNMYLGHSPTVTFLGVELVSFMPGAIGSGGAIIDDFAPAIF